MGWGVGVWGLDQVWVKTSSPDRPLSVLNSHRWCHSSVSVHPPASLSDCLFVITKIKLQIPPVRTFCLFVLFFVFILLLLFCMKPCSTFLCSVVNGKLWIQTPAPKNKTPSEPKRSQPYSCLNEPGLSVRAEVCGVKLFL